MQILNKAIFVSTLLFIFIFPACNNASESKLAYTDKETVRDIINQKESEISWTKELDPERLSEKYSNDDLIDKETITFTPDIAKVLKNFDKKVYPELIDFGKLDTSALSYSVLDKVNNFCSAVSSDIYSGPETYFHSNYKFNYVFFKNDLIDNWEKNFSEEFPFSLEYANEIKEKKQNNDQINNKIKNIEDKLNKYKEWKEKNENSSVIDDESSETESISEEMVEPEETLEDIEKLKKELVEIEEVSIFTKWLIGEPFIADELIEMPIRFYYNQGTIDITLYLNQKKQNSIYQITIDRWCKA